MKGRGQVEAMLRFSRKRLNQRTKRPIAKHAGETLKVVFVPAVPAKEQLAAPAEVPEGVLLRRGEVGRWG